MTTKQLLRAIGACSDAIVWVGDRTLQQAWAECPHGDWMLWLCSRMMGQQGWPSEEQIVLTVCACAKTPPKYAEATAAIYAVYTTYGAVSTSWQETANICRRMLTIPSEV